MLTSEQKAEWTEILQEFGPSGSEERIRSLMVKRYRRYTSEIIQDNMGSTFAVLRNKKQIKNPKKVMVISHCDEVGFMVKSINDKGLLSLNPLGGMWAQTLLAKRLLLMDSAGCFHRGAISAIAPHLLSEQARNRPAEIADMLADFGFNNRAEVMKAGIQPGDFVICDEPTVFLNNDQRILSKAIDNRMGVILGLELLKRVSNENRDFDLYVGFSTQEEVGTRGAKTAVNLVNPDFCVITDVSPGQDYQSSSTFGQLGNGVMVRGMDREYVSRKDIIAYQRSILEKNKIANQFYISPGGTDASKIHLHENGVPTLQACLIARNIHTVSGIIDVSDFMASLAMVEAVIKDLSEDKINQFNWTKAGL